MTIMIIITIAVIMLDIKITTNISRIILNTTVVVYLTSRLLLFCFTLLSLPTLVNITVVVYLTSRFLLFCVTSLSLTTSVVLFSRLLLL